MFVFVPPNYHPTQKQNSLSCHNTKLETSCENHGFDTFVMYCQVTEGDVNYPQVLLQGADNRSEAEFRRGWFPTLDRVLLILSKVYRILEVPTFQGIAQESVNVCLRIL